MHSCKVVEEKEDDSEKNTLPDWCEIMFEVSLLTPQQEFTLPETWANFYVETVRLSKEQIKNLCSLTISQGKSDLWRQERKTRITASRAHKILRARADHKRVEYFLDHKSLEHISHVRRGIELEPIALKKYQQLVSHQVGKAGLVVKDQHLVRMPF